MKLLRILWMLVVSLQAVEGIAQQETSQMIYAIMVDNTRLNPQKSKSYAKKLLTLSKERKQLDSIAIAYVHLAKAGRVEGSYEEALNYANLGIEFAVKNKVSKAILAELYLTKANNLADSGKAKASAETMFKGIEIAETSGDIKAKVLLNHGLAYTYMASQDFKKSKRVLHKNLALIEAHQLLDKKSFEAYYKGMILLSNIYTLEQKKDSTLLYLRKGLNHVLTTNDVFTTIGFYESLAALYIADKDYEKAYKNLQKSRELSNRIGNKYISTLTDFNFAKYYYATSAYEKAKEELEKIVSYYDLHKDLIVNAEVYKLLAKTYKKLGNLEKANENYELYVLKFQNNQEVNKELTGIVQDKELLAIHKEKQQQAKFMLYIILGGGAVIALLLIYLFSLASTKKKESIRFKELLAKVAVLENQSEDETTKVPEATKSSIDNINPETYQEILTGLQKLEAEHYFLKQECSSYTVAKKIKTNTSYLSKVINAHYDKNFNGYINDLRINYALLKLKEDRKFRLYAVQSIAEELGYKSPDSFTKYFKKHTGLLPSVYIKKLNTLS